jgi:hypothetical protein
VREHIAGLPLLSRTYGAFTVRQFFERRLQQLWGVVRKLIVVAFIALLVVWVGGAVLVWNSVGRRETMGTWLFYLTRHLLISLPTLIRWTLWAHARHLVSWAVGLALACVLAALWDFWRSTPVVVQELPGARVVAEVNRDLRPTLLRFEQQEEVTALTRVRVVTAAIDRVLDVELAVLAQLYNYSTASSESPEVALARLRRADLQNTRKPLDAYEVLNPLLSQACVNARWLAETLLYQDYVERSLLLDKERLGPVPGGAGAQRPF